MYQLFSVRDINAQDRQVILERFGLTYSQPLARGSEAEVYELGNDRLLKLYAGRRETSALQALQQISMAQNPGGVHIPEIYELLNQGTVTAVVEERINGVPLVDILPELSPSDHERIETLYLNTVWNLKDLPSAETYTSYLLFDSPNAPYFDSFGQYYAYHLRQKITLLADDFGIKRTDFKQEATHLADRISVIHAPLSLVHGDFYEGNIMVDKQTGEVLGVIDFITYSFIRGHYLLDVAGAYSYYRMYDPERDQIRARLLNKILARLTDEERPIFYQFLLGNAIMTCDLYAGGRPLNEDGHFNWALEIVRNEEYWQGALA